VAIKRVGHYAVDYPLIPLETVAGKTRVMEDHFINDEANDVTFNFLRYARPLIGVDMPEVAQLRMAKVAKAGLLQGDGT
jgi:6-phosphofructokinase 1